MKITTCFNSTRQLVLVLVAVSLVAIVYAERMETIASFKSNFKLAKRGNLQKKSRNLQKAPAAPKATPDAPIANGGIATGSPLPGSTSAIPPADAPKNAPTDSNDKSKIVKEGEELPDIPIYYQGWVKYFRYLENGKQRPKMFFKNTAFEKQMRTATPNVNLTEKDKYGPKKIPSEKHFFFVIYKDTANILTSRENPLMDVADSLTIDFIKTIPEGNNFLGGVKDFGKFSEGSCFEVVTVKPGAFFQMSAQETEPEKGLKEVWLLCSDDDAAKKQIMSLIINLKLKKQHSLGVYVTSQKDPRKSSNESLSPVSTQPTIADVMNNNPQMTDANKLNDPKRKKIDGHWIILQDWTPCTLKCGGGLQYLQLMCMPPEKGGKACDGEAIRTKPCNPHPCPRIETIKKIFPDTMADATQKVEIAIVKMMPISTRPQRYDKCYLKETDAVMIKEDKNFASSALSAAPKIPVRLIMNNKSITVYKDESLQTNLVTFILSGTKFTREKGENTCFTLIGLNNKAKFCQMDAESGNFVEGWDYDFHLFKNQCMQQREVIKLNENEDLKLAKDYQDKLNQLKKDMMEKKADEVKKQVETNEEGKLQKKIEQTQAMTLMAIQKELKLEELLEKEEADRENDERKQLQLQIEAEKNKKDCLTKSIKEKQLEEQMNLSKANAEEAILRIKEEAKKQIMIKRAQMKKKLEAMRKKNKRRLTQMQNEIITIRTETAGKVQHSAKVGKMDNCFNPASLPTQALATTTSKLEEYCQVNFPDNNAKFMECKGLDTFCFLCCENEFGELHLAEREKCMRSVCESDANSAAVLACQKP